jgi:hypothetical protein
MCYEYSDWAWKARAAELAKKERKVSQPQKKPERTEPQGEPVVETSPKERDTVPA